MFLGRSQQRGRLRPEGTAEAAVQGPETQRDESRPGDR